ncbi:30S ribosomal protein S19 [Candidatus Woesearchaeota archaeon]|nr:30S ribosomal protein S19 [Candidatus Woesearchaeota archaeon]
MAKEFVFRGKKFEEIKNMNIKEFAGLLTARERRTLIRGFTDEQKILLEKIRKNRPKLRTHCRDMIIVPDMVGKIINVYSGKTFMPVRVEKEMLGHRLGEFVLTRNKVAHSAPGIGATRSSAALSVR